MVVKRLDWTEVDARLRIGPKRWKQGEHVSIIGPTGYGKTYLGLKLLEIRQYKVIFVVKRQDDTMSSYARKQKFKRLQAWEPDTLTDRYIIWPKYDSPDDELRQYFVFRYAMQQMFVAGNWTLFIDELNYFAGIDSNLKLDKYCRMYWQQGRSLGLSFVTATQRPYKVPSYMYDQPTHLFFFRFGDERDLSRIGGISWLSRSHIREVVANLDKYQFLYIYVPDGEMIVSKAD